jgi:hypothetical protein
MNIRRTWSFRKFTKNRAYIKEMCQSNIIRLLAGTTPVNRNLINPKQTKQRTMKFFYLDCDQYVINAHLQWTYSSRKSSQSMKLHNKDEPSIMNGKERNKLMMATTLLVRITLIAKTTLTVRTNNHKMTVKNWQSKRILKRKLIVMQERSKLWYQKMARRVNHHIQVNQPIGNQQI